MIKKYLFEIITNKKDIISISFFSVIFFISIVLFSINENLNFSNITYIWWLIIIFFINIAYNIFLKQEKEDNNTITIVFSIRNILLVRVFVIMIKNLFIILWIYKSVISITELIVIIYSIYTILHFTIQLIMASLYHRENNDKSINSKELKNTKVLLLIPTYKEEEKIFVKCINTAIKAVSKVDWKVAIINNEKTNPIYREKLKKKYSDKKNIVLFLHSTKQWKREAQVYWYKHIIKKYKNKRKPEYIQTLDSDTILDKNVTLYFLKEFKKHKDAWAITWTVLVKNKDVNIVTKIQSLRYFLAFQQERASQWLFWSVVVCSWPLSMYKTSFFENIMDEYENQYFLWIKCTFWDDRHLTNLTLREWYNIYYAKYAIAYTDVPESILKFIKQQTRRNKSYMREFLIALKFMIIWKKFKLNRLFIIYELITAVILPIFLGINIFFILTNWNFLQLYKYFFLLIAIARLRSTLWIIWDTYNSRQRYLIYFPIFWIVNLVIFLPIKLYWFATCRINERWTR